MPPIRADVSSCSSRRPDRNITAHCSDDIDLVILAHSVSFGFKWPERHHALAALKSWDAARRVIGLAFQINLGEDLQARLSEMEAFGAANDLLIWANVRLADENPAVANFDDELILQRVRVAVEAAETLKRTTVEIDTLIDIDRGYNPRHGLLDRRCNLRPAGTWLARRQALG